MPARSTPMPARSAPMSRGKELRRTPPAETADKPRGRRDTGPTAKVRKLAYDRSGGWCEWPGCTKPRAELHHRLNRKDGGRHGEMRHRINQAAWLLAACSDHHRLVTSPVGADRELAESSGWLLREGPDQDARLVPVLTRHAPGPVLLDNRGNWQLAA